ncbi:Aste57867_1254 [Aphanomyces stellatus]|uniref:GDT1 family protein n=1 Tax=Aphanomyces stellatus TaxID=120398 RepID=A0A485K602_9STRA|nr:hypothetical protein As57867_001253 [Aphanomyces stellatus]VFT78473.1 Aste57867_1254 [Aphanomyces stellatus]
MGVSNRQFLLFALLTSVLSFSEGGGKPDAFDVADQDHDGVIQREEFVKWSQNVRNAINPLLVPDENALDRLPLITNDRVKPEATDDGYNAAVKKGKNSAANKFWSGFISGIVTIWATEVGDKTFFIAAILSMKHDRIVVFAGAISALIVMTVLSVVLGGVAALLLPPWLTHYAGAILFVVFGAKMLYDSREMNANGPSEELTEVEEELEGKKNAEEAGNAESGTIESVPKAVGAEGMFQVFSQGFLLTFLAEWGDRSQIATITLSASNDAFGVTLGAILGHSMCTGLAVVGGKFLASRISEKTVTIVGGAMFLLFALHAFAFPPHD